MKCLDKKRIKMKGGETLALNERIMLSLVSTGVSLCNPCKSCCWNSFDFRVTVFAVVFVWQICGFCSNFGVYYEHRETCSIFSEVTGQYGVLCKIRSEENYLMSFLKIIYMLSSDGAE